MEPLFDLLCTVEFRPRFLNVRIARESFQQHQGFLVSDHLLFWSGDHVQAMADVPILGEIEAGIQIAEKIYIEK